MPANTITARRTCVRVEIEPTVTDGSPVLDGFGQSEPVTGVQLSFVDGKLTAIRLDTAVPHHSAFVDQPDLERPEKWPAFLREMVSAHGPAAESQELARLRAMEAVMQEVFDTAMEQALDG